jgi:putative spermidine/putrescine transport system permease protein
VTAVAFLQFYNELATRTGLDVLGTFPGLVAAHLFLTIPYGVSSVAVMLARLGPQWEEAAQSLGATPWSCFRRVTLPAIRPGLFAAFFYAFIVSFGDVPVALFVGTGSSFVTMPVEIFQTLQFDFDPAVLALSTVVVALSALMIVAVQRLIGLDLVVPANRR